MGLAWRQSCARCRLPCLVGVLWLELAAAASRAPPPVSHHSLRASQPAMGPGRKVAQVPASPVVATGRAAQQAPGWPGPHPLAVGRRHATGQGRHQGDAGLARHQRRSRGTPTPPRHPTPGRQGPAPRPARCQPKRRGGMGGGLLASRYGCPARRAPHFRPNANPMPHQWLGNVLPVSPQPRAVAGRRGEGQCEGNGLCDVKAMVQRRVPLHPPP